MCKNDFTPERIIAIARARAPHIIEQFEKEDKERELRLIFEDREDVEWDNNVETEQKVPIIFQLIRLAGQTIRDVVQTEEWLPMAAGVREDFPPLQELEPSLFEGDPVRLTFEHAQDSNGLLIGLEGASIAIRAGVALVVTYADGEQTSFAGKDIAMGGHWELPDTGKKVQRVELIFNRDDDK